MKDNSTISVAALTVSAIALSISWLTYRRDRPKAKVVVFKSSHTTGMKRKQSYLTITVTNIGRRPLTLTHLGYRKLWNFKLHALMTNADLPIRLEEGDSTYVLAPKSEVLENSSWKGVAYVYAIDRTGKIYRYDIARFYKIWFLRVLDFCINRYKRNSYYLRRKDSDS